MNTREVYDAIQSGDKESARQAQFQLLRMVQQLSTAVLELAGVVEEQTGKDPLNQRSRLWLSEFLELPRREVSGR